MPFSSLCIIGSTGLVGKEILRNLNSHPELCSKVYSLTRRPVPNLELNSHVQEIIESDSSKWAEQLEKLSSLNVFVSSLGTTRTAEGSLEKQYKVDHDLNYEMAKTAKEKLGCETYVLISSTGASSGSRFPYLKMKGELEDHVKELKFNKTIILQPGVLLGAREKPKNLGNKVMAGIGSFFTNTVGYRLMNAVSGEELGKVVYALLKESESYEDGTVKVLSGPEVLAKLKEIK